MRTLMTIEVAMCRSSFVLSGYATALGNGVRWWGVGMKSTSWVSALPSDTNTYVGATGAKCARTGCITVALDISMSGDSSCAKEITST